MDYPKSPIIIIDCYGFIYRAYYTQPKLTNPEGKEVGAVYGFMSMIIKLLTKFNPKSMLAVFDSAGKSHRCQIYQEYKSHRPETPTELKEQIALITEATKVLNILTISKYGIEADDIIATVATKFASNSNPVIVISPDKDLLQLMEKNVQIYNPSTEKVINEQEVIEKFGVKPSQIKDYLAIVGDGVDNIPGVKGIGPKGASILINEFGNVEEIFKNVDKAHKKYQKLLIAGEETCRMSLKLTELVYDVDIDFSVQDLIWEMPKREDLTAFLLEHQFRSLFNRATELYNSNHLSLTHESSNVENVEVISSINQLKNVIKEASKAGKIGLYLEKKVFPRLYLSYFGHKCYIINTSRENIEDSNTAISIILDLLKDPAILKITYDVKTLMRNLVDYLFSEQNIELAQQAKQIEIQGVEDLMLMYYSLETKYSSNNDIKSIISHISGIPNINSIVHLVSKFFDTYQKLKDMLFEAKTFSLYHTFDLPLAKAIFDMEMQGILLDANKLQELDEDFANQMEVLSKTIFAACKQEFNLASPKQISEIVIEPLNLPRELIKPTKTGNYSTNAIILEALSDNGIEIASQILEWRKLHKLRSTYTTALLKQKNKLTGRIHTLFSQTKTNTGRLNSIHPNLQNIPIKTVDGNKVRSAFISESGYSLISADYAQMELKILAHVANVTAMQEAFKNNIDVHTETASKIFNVNLNEVTKVQRDKAKTINFSVIYGITSFGLGQRMKIPASQAQEYIDNYFKKYPEIHQYMQETKDFAKQHNYTLSIFNRRCSILNMNSKNYHLRQFAERAAINARIQASAADIMRIAMIEVNKNLNKNKINCKMLLQIHDELLFECKNDDIESAKNIIQTTMENVANLSMPLTATLKVSSNWT
jgi:DNA polymerase-1